MDDVAVVQLRLRDALEDFANAVASTARSDISAAGAGETTTVVTRVTLPAHTWLGDRVEAVDVVLRCNMRRSLGVR